MGVPAAPNTWEPLGFGRGRRTNRIGFVTTSDSDVRPAPDYLGPWMAVGELDGWGLHLMEGIYASTGALGFSFVRCQRDPDEPVEAFVSRVESLADALVVVLTSGDALGLLPALRARGLPHVCAFARGPRLDTPFSVGDDAGGVVQVVHHLAALGHRRLAFLEGEHPHLDHLARKEGFLRGMAEANLPVDPALVSAGDHLPSATQLLRLPDRPTAIVCATDVLARAAGDACWSLGLKVPHDIALVGFDDLGDAEHAVPALTTVRQPARQIAGCACYLAACLVVGQQPSTGWRVEVPGTLVVRDSCGARLAGLDGSEPASSSTSVETRSQQPELEIRLRQIAAMNQEMQDFLNVASHDLRAPLVTIDGFADSLQRRYSDLLDERGRTYVDGIRQSAAHLRYLTDTLLELSRLQSQPLHKTPVAVGDVLSEVVHDLQGLMSEKGAMLDLRPNLPTVLADEIALRQIFANLIGNALKYLGDQPHPTVVVRYKRREDEHEFSVADNGIGIAPEHQDEIFQLYRRVPGTDVEGTGIGLTMVKRWVLRHGGRIWVESQPGQGSTFRFTLPRSPVDEVAPAAEPEAEAVAT